MDIGFESVQFKHLEGVANHELKPFTHQALSLVAGKGVVTNGIFALRPADTLILATPEEIKLMSN